MFKGVLLSLGVACFCSLSSAFSVVSQKGLEGIVRRHTGWKRESALFLSDILGDEAAEATQERIKSLVEEHPILLFMKGSKLFPQCGFSNNAVQLLNSYGIEYHTVDVLADQAIREGVKVFSEWPTIPQLFVAGEFIGGSDIMIEMYQSGELGEVIEKAKADSL